jgi:hypothetical protein
MLWLPAAQLFTIALGAALFAGSGCGPREDGLASAPGAAAHDSVLSALRKSDALERSAALAATFEQLGPADVPEVRRAFRNAQFSVALGDRVLLAHWWGRHDPNGALEWARRELESPQIVEIALEEFAAVDPDAAQRELQSLPPQRKLALGQALIRGWFRSGKPGLVEYIRSHEYGIQQAQLLSAYLRALMGRDGPDAVTAWARSLPPELSQRDREMAYQRVTATLASLDPALAFGFALEHFRGESGAGLMQIVAAPWGRSDGLAAVTKMSQLGDGPQKLAGVDTAWRAWLKVDRPAALDFAASSVDEPWFDRSLEYYARIIGVRDGPREGMKLADTIRDPVLKQDAYVKIARYWRGSDEQAVREWLKTVDLPKIAHEQIWYELPGAPGHSAAMRKAEEAEALGQVMTPEGPANPPPAPEPN